MAPMPLYGSAVLAAAREYPFESLTGCEVRVECAEDLYGSNAEWAALWPSVRRRTACAVFLDHLGGWVSRGVYVEVQHLLADGKPVWWWCGGNPTEKFGFGPGVRGDWQYRYRRVGLGYPRPIRRVISKPFQAAREGRRAHHL